MSSFIFKTKKLILLLGDITCLYFSLYLALYLRNNFQVSPDNWLSHLQAFTIIFCFWILVFYINDFYDLKTSYNNFSLLGGLFKSLLINGIIVVLVFYFLSSIFPSIKPQRMLIIQLVVTLITLFTWRKIFYNLIRSEQIANKVLILGNSSLLPELIEEVKRRPQLGYQLQMLSTAPENLKKYCLNNQIDILISSQNLSANDNITKEIFDCLSLGVDVYNINGFYEIITQKIPVEHIEISWFLENLTENSKKSFDIIKRLLDLIIVIIGLIPALLLTPIIALIIKLESPGPIIFKQIRVGKHGKNFLAMKFRSMISEAEKNGAQWATENDPRVTRFGRIMRKTRLDEIPQLVNILRGEMSLIGPRPERPEFVKLLIQDIPFYQERLLIKPGLTGWAQLLGPAYGGSKEESLEKLKYDLYYIKNRSLLLDLSIILKTIRVVLGGKGQ
jgi:exopolysaccharide biosynthesis polyprenyl glycosylphosphotransferase